jgi:hypothetical protein
LLGVVFAVRAAGAVQETAAVEAHHEITQRRQGVVEFVDGHFGVAAFGCRRVAVEAAFFQEIGVWSGQHAKPEPGEHTATAILPSALILHAADKGIPQGRNECRRTDTIVSE